MLLLGFAAVFYIAGGALFVSPAFRAALVALLATPQPHRQQYLAPLDGLRGLAAFWVACFHCWQWTQPHYDPLLRYFPLLRDGNDAVPIFVALSGFLIYRSVRAINSAAELKKYAWRRWLRIYPLYFVTAVLALIVVPIAGLGPQRIIAELLMWRAFGYPAFLNPPAWSLYVEVVFYAVVPAYAFVSRRHPLPFAVLAFFGLFVIGIFGNRELELWKFFAIGICVSCLYDRFGAKVGQMLPGALFLIGVGGIVLQYSSHAALNEFALAIAIGCLIFGSLTFSPAAVLLRARPFRVLGAISYSVFLWHSFLIMAGYHVMFDGRGYLADPTGPIPVFLGPAWTLPLIYVPALIAVGALSFLLIERSMLSFRESAPGDLLDEARRKQA